ncbi:MAG TPA: hypothetical protein DCZ94_14580 [Lentisphaeria bacterium]|nr:MAG: hypothetical protein A2X48_09995 [Lentisphaerae bacterium GWF2_49_21]HBC88173.1 hypothetical protein [Lentisphaeria bacterium]
MERNCVMKMKTFVFSILVSLFCISCGAADNTTSSMLIVRFVDGVSKEKAKEKIEGVGASMVEIVSAERSTYLARCTTSSACDKAVRQLQNDKQVKYAERENVYAADQKKQQLKQE